MQTIYQQMDSGELAQTIASLKDEVAAVKARGLALDMARGKPSPVASEHLAPHARYLGRRFRSA